jgi:hypothetical protein
MRRSDITQLYLAGFGVAFLLVVSVQSLASQPVSQEAINATIFERINGITYRLDQLEYYVKAAILALIANGIAHVVQIKTQRDQRRRGADDDHD